MFSISSLKFVPSSPRSTTHLPAIIVQGSKDRKKNFIDMPYFDMLCSLVLIVVDFYGDQVCDTTYRDHGKCG